jgi:hypothetical protein
MNFAGLGPDLLLSIAARARDYETSITGLSRENYANFVKDVSLSNFRTTSCR